MLCYLVHSPFWPLTHTLFTLHTTMHDYLASKRLDFLLRGDYFLDFQRELAQ